MKLSELHTGERGVIVKVLGHGGFRKRIVEMGFIKGKVIEVQQGAPLQDPVKYKVMGYELSLRRDEAEMIEVLSEKEAKRIEAENTLASSEFVTDGSNSEETQLSDAQMREMALRKRRQINVALVGNPNCGKTSLFNFASGAHERVGNYSGVTVDAKEGVAEFEGYEFHIFDLPGTYSLSTYSPEEIYVRRQIIDRTPDIVINVIDASNIERNLYLTTQLVDMHLRMVCALNMYDELERRGDRLNTQKLGQLFGIPMIPTSFKSGRGVDLLFHIIINMYEGVDFLDKHGNITPEVARDIQEWHKHYENHHGGNHEEDYAHGNRPNRNVYRHFHLNHGKYVEEGIKLIKEELQNDEIIRHRYSTRYVSIKLLERDGEMETFVRGLHNGERLLQLRDEAAERIKRETHEDCEQAVMNAKYAFIHGALHEAEYEEGKHEDAYHVTHIIDRVITNRYVGFPAFFVLIYVMFQCTFTLGSYPMDWIQAGVDALGAWVQSALPDGPLKAMLAEGVVGGVGAVIVFMPQILILYAFISFMEDCGYMARAAFIMDKVMHKIGLHGKSFVPLIMGFGCNVPAVMATRTIENKHNRLVTMLIVPLMSCSARLPIYIIITGTFFAARWQGTVMMLLYIIGVVAALLASRVLSRVVAGTDTPFVMELPPYRFPSAATIWRHTWEKGKEYIKKMGGVILVASLVVWALGYFPHNDALSAAAQKEQSYIGQIGKAVEPAFSTMGFDWKLDVALISGVGAKEIVASTIGVLYEADTLREAHTPLVAFCFLLFVLLYFPCMATLAAIKNESGSWRWALFAAAYTTVMAWVVATAVYQVGRLL